MLIRRRLRDAPTDPLALLYAQAAQLQEAIGSGVTEIETPQLGRVQYATIDELIKALALVNNQIAALAGGGESRTQPVVALRGLWPRRSYVNEEGGEFSKL